LLTLAGWLHLRGRGVASGALLAVAATLKLYPALFVVFFLFKRRWHAVAGFSSTFALLMALGAMLFGAQTMRDYATDVLPRALAGEGIDPYYVGFNSSTALLRRLFVAEPDLN